MYSVRESSAVNTSGGAQQEVSTALCRSERRSSVSNRKAGCASGSPPEKVTPPPDAAKSDAPRRIRSASAAEVSRSPIIFRRPFGQTSVHRPQAVQPSGWGQTFLQLPHPVQEAVRTISSGANRCPSGLWHHVQRSGQPFKKAVARTPGPSCTVNSDMFISMPLSIRLTPVPLH